MINHMSLELVFRIETRVSTYHFTGYLGHHQSDALDRESVLTVKNETFFGENVTLCLK